MKALASALIYFISLIDINPGFVPGVGYIDDVLVLATCWKHVESDVNEYVAWRKSEVKKILSS